MLNYQHIRKGSFFVIVWLILGLLCLAALASTQTTAEPALADVPEEISVETETPCIWLHLEISASISPAPVVGQTATVR